ncbi:hypothetical protein [Luteolibacter sp. Populi]|uniref:hypothetical protein n=1 Tax=Luteolibacter sp. Populi TaxID=3230487 RepID=UPI00346725F3
MKPSGERILFAAACLAALGAGVFLRTGREAGRAVVAVLNNSPEAAVTTTARAAGESKVISATALREMMLRRSLAACETAALWKWLEADPQGDWDIRRAVIEELIDRLGWGAWGHALAIADPKARESLADSFISQFAGRDPWKAYEEWKKHRGEFDPEWGVGVIGYCTLAGAAVSADKLLDVFRQVTRPDSCDGMKVEYAKDFDFRKVVDYIVGTDKQPYAFPQDLVREWAKREPEEAAAWLAAHPEYLAKDYRAGELRETLKAIAETEMGEESRRKALDAIGKADPEMLDRAWAYLGNGSGGKVSASILESADFMGRRDEYLRRVLLDSRSVEKLDDSWTLVPLAERREILRAAEVEWAEQRPTPVDAKARARWRKMVTGAWGIGP